MTKIRCSRILSLTRMVLMMMLWTTVLLSSSFFCSHTHAFSSTAFSSSITSVLQQPETTMSRFGQPSALLPRHNHLTTTSRRHSTFESTTRPHSISSSSTSLHSSSSSVWAYTLDTIRTFSSSSALQTVTDRALQTPPVVYFCALLLAGLGVPVSEDALCLFAGTVWNTMDRRKQLNLVLSLYGGVVLSDVVTFWIGQALRTGMLEPLRNRLQLNSDATDNDDEKGTEMSMVSVEALEKGGRVRKRDKLRNAMTKSGDYVGFVIRFSVGTRGPLMLLTGFTNRVKFWKFLVGTSLGAMITVPLQLYLGYALGHNHPAAVVTVVGGISTFVLATAAVIGVASWGTLLLRQVQKWQKG